MASLVLLLSELLKHQNQDPSGLILSQTSSPGVGCGSNRHFSSAFSVQLGCQKDVGKFFGQLQK
ncbi:hypothetical protein Acr_08g0002760 [Actinidia rufa]|uniref:Uncharacterized protein n=1 Tax=Actinidia rufa TaxID=165716 RepID=A0A7J0EZM4_9ERIC|nr:hypothetical protein Acr_08g0002760 [Actinidia rufa]